MAEEGSEKGCLHGCHVYTKTTKVKITDKGLAIKSLDINVIYAIDDCCHFKSAYRAVWDAHEVANHV